MQTSNKIRAVNDVWRVTAHLNQARSMLDELRFSGDYTYSASELTKLNEMYNRICRAIDVF